MHDILFVITALRVGGSERQLALLTGELTRSGADVAVYSFMDGAARALFEEHGVEVLLAPGHIDLVRSSRIKSALLLGRAAAHLFWIMLTRRPKIVHFFLPAAYLIGVPMAVLARVPVRVMSRRSLNDYQRSHLVRTLERNLHRLMHAVLGNSRAIIAQLQQEGVPRRRLGLIYNGIDAGRFACSATRAESRAGLGLPPESLVMCTIANLIPYKGHRHLIDALALAAPHISTDWRLLVVGRDDGIGAELKQQASRLGLKDRIMFLGARTDVPAILAAGDIGILCSQGNEGFSNAVLEGMAAGLPMIVTDVGGNAEAVIDGETGLVVPPRDVERLAAAIVRLANDPALCAQYGAAGRRRVVDHFGVQRFGQSHRALYRALLAGKQPSDVAEVRLEADG